MAITMTTTMITIESGTGIRAMMIDMEMGMGMETAMAMDRETMDGLRNILVKIEYWQLTFCFAGKEIDGDLDQGLEMEATMMETAMTRGIIGKLNELWVKIID